MLVRPPDPEMMSAAATCSGNSVSRKEETQLQHSNVWRINALATLSGLQLHAGFVALLVPTPALLGLQPLAQGLCEIPSGWLADVRLGRRNTLALATAVRLLAVFLLLLLQHVQPTSGRYTGELLLGGAAMVLQGVANALVSGSVEALLFDSLQGHRQAYRRALARSHLLWPAATAAAAVVGAVVFPHARGPELCLLGSLLTLAVALLVSLSLVEPAAPPASPLAARPQTTPAPPPHRHIYAVLRGLHSDVQLRRWVLFSVALLSITATVARLQPTFLAAKGLDPSSTAWLSSLSYLLSSGGWLLSAPACAACGAPAALALATSATAAALAAAVFLPGLPGALCLLLPGLLTGLQRPVLSDNMQSRVAASQRATVISVLALVRNLAEALLLPLAALAPPGLALLLAAVATMPLIMVPIT